MAWTVRYSGSPAPIPMALSRLTALNLSSAVIDADLVWADTRARPAGCPRRPVLLRAPDHIASARSWDRPEWDTASPFGLRLPTDQKSWSRGFAEARGLGSD